MLVLHTVRYDDWKKELQWFENWHCFEIVSYKDDEWKDWFQVYYDTQKLAVLWRIWEAEQYCKGLADWLCAYPTWYEGNKLIMSLLIADNWEKSAKWVCLWHLFEVKYDEDEEWYETYPIFIWYEQVEEAWCFEEALAYCYWYAEWLDPNKPLYLKKWKWVINILKD